VATAQKQSAPGEAMSEFIQFHILTSYPPANLNRDDLGRPKTAMFGGTQRLRVSSQSLKRAWRTSDVFASALKIGIRTKDIGNYVFNQLREKNAGKEVAVEEVVADEIAKRVAAVFGKSKAKSDEAGTRVLPASVREIAVAQGVACHPKWRMADATKRQVRDPGGDGEGQARYRGMAVDAHEALSAA
jgi:hypothetical protein